MTEYKIVIEETAENGEDAAVAAYLPAGKYIYEFKEGEGIAAKVLNNKGVTEDKIKAKIEEL